MKIRIAVSFILVFLVSGVILLINLTPATAKIDKSIPYNLELPDDTFYLPNKLREISGLSYFDNNRILGIQDEDGLVFIYNLKRNKLDKKIKFGHDADYEGVEKVGDSIYVLRSDGTIYRVKDLLSDNPDKKKYKTHLSSKNDTEGLAFDKTKNRLLVLCKEHPGKGLKGKRAIYSFDLTAEKLSDNPTIKLDIQLILSMTDNVRKGFKPSAISIHPINNEIYIIDSVGKILVVLNADNSVKSVSSLPEKLFTQPEGLTFTPDGDLLISNEGDDVKANILYFKLLK